MSKNLESMTKCQRQPISKWYDIQEMDTFLDVEVCPGDILQMELVSGLNHYAIYIGHQKSKTQPFIVHCWPRCCTQQLPGTSLWRAIVGGEDKQHLTCRRDILEDVSRDTKRLRVANELDADWEPHQLEEILERATSQAQGVAVPKFKSCKHFALWCRYDENYLNCLAEETLNRAATLKTGALFGTLFGATIASVGYYLFCTSNNKKEDEEATKKAKDERSKKKDEVSEDAETFH